jgi:hypothetical protein
MIGLENPPSLRKRGALRWPTKVRCFWMKLGISPWELQPKLLPVLQEREFERLGSTRTKKADVRVVAATHHDLEEMILKKEFRSDGYLRLRRRLVPRDSREACAGRRTPRLLCGRASQPDRKDLSRTRDVRARRASVRSSANRRQVPRDR